MISGFSGRATGVTLEGFGRGCAGANRCGTIWSGAFKGGAAAAGGSVGVGAVTAGAGAFWTGGSGEVETVGGRAAVLGTDVCGGAAGGDVVVETAGGE